MRTRFWSPRGIKVQKINYKVNLIFHNFQCKNITPTRKALNFDGMDGLFLLQAALDLLGCMTCRKMLLTSPSCMLLACEHILKPPKKEKTLVVARVIHVAPHKDAYTRIFVGTLCLGQ